MIVDCLNCGAPWDVRVKTHDVPREDEERAGLVLLECYGITCPACGQKGVRTVVDSVGRRKETA